MIRWTLPHIGQAAGRGLSDPGDATGADVTISEQAEGYLCGVQRGLGVKGEPSPGHPREGSVFPRLPVLRAVRTGLTVVGIVIAVVGAAVFLTIVLDPPTTLHTTITPEKVYGPAEPTNVSVNNMAIYFPASPRASLFLIWSSNGSIDASFYAGSACTFYNGSTGQCTGNASASWSGASSGTWNTTAGHPLACPCYLTLRNNEHAYPISVEALLLETYQQRVPALDTFSYVSVLFGSILLLGIGCLATFFGLFLPSGVFRRTVPDGLDDEPEDIDAWQDAGRPPGAT